MLLYQHCHHLFETGLLQSQQLLDAQCHYLFSQAASAQANLFIFIAISS
jgi:hypothetical protein